MRTDQLTPVSGACVSGQYDPRFSPCLSHSIVGRADQDGWAVGKSTSGSVSALRWGSRVRNNPICTEAFVVRENQSWDTWERKWLRKLLYWFLEAVSGHYHIHYSLLQGSVPPGSGCKAEGLCQFYWIHREPLWPFSLSAVFPFYQRAALCKLLFSHCMFCWVALLKQDRPWIGRTSPFKAKVGFQLP